MKIGEIMQKSKMCFNIENLTSKDLLPLYIRLKELGYDEENINNRLGVKDREFVMPAYLPFYLRIKLKENTLLDRLIKLFTFSLTLREDEIREIFTGNILELCLKTGLLSCKNGEYSSSADLFPCMGNIFATDHYFSASFPKNHVYPLGYDSYLLARGIINSHSRRTLDLCTGSGVQAITAARFSDKVIGVDRNPRALNFAKFNALLNQAGNVEFVQGDLYEPVQGERFDLILANPPFVPAPSQKLYFRDGGETGEEILEKIVAGIPRFLNDGGYAQIVTVMVLMKISSYTEKVRQWLGEDAFCLLTMNSKYIDVEPFILGHISPDRKFDEYCDLVESWALNYEKNNIEKLIEGLINIKKTGKGKWSGRQMNINRMTKPFSGEVKNLLNLMEKQEDREFLTDLKGLKFQLNHNIKFFWEGLEPEDRRNYGALFKEESLPVEDTELKKIHYKILCSIHKGKNTFKMMEEEIKRNREEEEIYKEEEILKSLSELLVRGVVEVHIHSDLPPR